jgi:threonine/homoserine/homoserine lactone efflux protein
MLSSIYNGLIFGLLLAIMIGPVFFALIQLSLKDNFNKAIAFALGVAICDAMYILFITFAAKLISLEPSTKAHYTFYASLLGGGVLILFGLFYLKGRGKHQTEQVVSEKSTLQYFTRGFLLNFINPAVFFFWLGAIGFQQTKSNATPLNNTLFFTTTLLVVFGTDVLKAKLAGVISKYLKPEVLLKVNRTVGIILCIFGIRIIYQAIQVYYAT